jgi:hypothetical protein
MINAADIQRREEESAGSGEANLNQCSWFQRQVDDSPFATGLIDGKDNLNRLSPLTPINKVWRIGFDAVDEIRHLMSMVNMANCTWISCTTVS